MASQDTGSKLVNSVILTLIARTAIILATAALPVVGYMMQGISNKLDTLHDQSIQTNGVLELIRQSAMRRDQMIADHESRMRTLESFNRRP